MSYNSSSPKRFLDIFLSIFKNWNAIGVLVAIFIFIITTYLQQGALVFELIDISSLVQEDAGDNWTLSYKNQSVNRPFSIIYLIENTGRIDIKKEDYQGNITIDFGESSVILDAFASKTEPSTLKDIIERDKIIKPSSTQSKTEIQPLLLKSGESITFKAIVDNFDPRNLGPPIARITGIEIKQSYSSTQKPELCLPISQPKWLVFSFVLGLSCLIALLAKLTSYFESKSEPELFVYSCILVLSMLGAATLLVG